MVTKFILRLHDFLMRHRRLALWLTALVLAGCVLSGLRLHFGEDVADFLPRSGSDARYASVYEQMGDAGRITIIFRPEEGLDREMSDSLLAEAVDAFGLGWEALDEAGRCRWQGAADDGQLMEAMDFLRHHVALFLTEADYARIDSLLAQPGYVDTCMSHVRRMLSFPMTALATEAVRADPLNLFSPVLQRLQTLSPADFYEVRDGYLFDREGRAYAFMLSPYASSDTRAGSRLAAQLQQVADSVEAQVQGVRVSAVGAPLIAAANADRIKTDSLWGGLAALVLIVMILAWSMRDWRNIAYLAFAVAAGWLFALGVVSLLRPTISIIVIGIGSVLLGIAVNYPLHYLEHLRSHPDRRLTLKEMVEPLLTGNVTTVSAFACLLFVKAEAMRDLGLFGALMLVGTILVVLTILPLVAATRKAGKEGANTLGRKYAGGSAFDAPAAQAIRQSSNQALKHSNTQAIKKVLFVVVAVLTLFLGLRSGNTRFDDDLHNINYMTSQQRDDLALLSRPLANGDSTDVVYWVSEAPTLDEALQACERWGGEGVSEESRGASLLLPSTRRQQEALERWALFCSRHGGLSAEVRRAAARQGFAPGAFEPFEAELADTYHVMPPEAMTCLCGLAENYLLYDDTSVRVVNMLHVPVAEAEQVKQTLRERWEGEAGLFAFDLHDVGSHLVAALNGDFNYILFVCGLVVFVFLWLSLGQLELALVSFLPLAVGWLWILGLMDLAGVSFNIVNIILATFIFGQGDDYSIFITEGLMYEYAYGRQRLRSYRHSVVVSALLMFAGMGVLLFARHPALKSLAVVAVMGMAVVIVMACLLPPVLMGWMTRDGGGLRRVPVTLRRLLNTLWAVTVLVVVAMVVATPLTLIFRLIGGKSRCWRLRFHGLICWCCRQGLRLLPGVSHKVVNTCHETFERPAVVVANHQSHLDLLCTLMLTPKLVVLTNDWVWRNPIYGVVIRYADYLPVTEGYEALLPRLRELVGEGYSVLVFPEGTRSTDGTVGRFHKGAFFLAQQLQLDILPVLVHGVQHVMPKKDWLLSEGTTTTWVGRRIGYESFADTDLQQLTRQMRHYFTDRYAALRRELEDEAYWLPQVRCQYLYKGREVSMRCRKALRRWQREGAAPMKEELATFEGKEWRELRLPPYSQQGELALLAALAHPDRVYRCRIDSEDDYRVATHCALRPDNLHFYCPSAADEEGGEA